MINRASVFTPEPGALITLRVPDKAKATHNWDLRLSRGIWVPDDRRNWTFRLEGQVVTAGPAEGIDQRLANQRESIDRLLKHLAKHCPRLLSGGECEHWHGQ